MFNFVSCGRCGQVCNRAVALDRKPGIPDVFTRTLVDQQFLPSCSEACANELRKQCGKRKAS